VEKYLLPHFDTEFAARMVLGRHWSVATPEQRQRFIAAFYHSLLTNYASALADFTSDRLQILPARVAPDATRATVHTKVKGSNGMVAVDYELRKTPQGWKAWNVIIEGISYVYSYREDFGSQIESQGIDAVIQRLEAGQKPAARKDSTPTV
jgi:phospholipid transport system substrate-binding protein